MITQFLTKIGVLNPVLRAFGISEYNHAKSSVYYVENEIKEETFENGDAILDTIVPTIDYSGDAYSPRMTFADSQGRLPTPEFYTEYPIFVSEDSPELKDFGSIYKLVPIEDINSSVKDINSLGLEIQLFDNDIGLRADIISIETYVLWSHTPDQLEYSEDKSPGRVNTLDDGDFEFESATGVLTITSESKLTEMLSRVIKDSLMIREDDEYFYDQHNWSYYVVFQVNVEKYRSVADLRDLTSEQVGKIATAQAIEAAIFEYNYQFNLATQTQMSYHELIYTVIVTAASTAITIGATLCVGQVVQLAGSLANTATKELSKSASKTLLGLLQPTAGFTASSVALAVVREIGQEVLIDPWIESAVSGWVRRAGGDAMMQMVLSSVAESLRETLTGPFTNLFSSQQSGGASFYEQLDAKYFSNGLKPTVQDLLVSFNEYKAEINAQIELRKEQMTTLGRGMKALTFVLGAAGFGVAQFIGPPTSLLYATLATVCFTEGISLKSVFRKTFNPVMVVADKIGKSKVGDFVRKNQELIFMALGIGVHTTFITMPITMFLMRSFGFLGGFVGLTTAPLTFFGMVTNKLTHIKKIPPSQTSLDKLVKTYLEVFTEEKDLVAKIPTRFKKVYPRIIHRSGLLSKNTLGSILGVSRGTLATVKQMFARRYATLFRIGTGPAYYRARTNSLKSKNNFDFATRAFYNYLEDYGLEVKYQYKIVEIFSSYSTAPNPSIYIGKIAKEIGLNTATHFTPTLGLIDSTIQRLINIFLLNPPDVAKFGIPAGKLESLQEDCYHATLGALVENEKIGMFVGLDTFKLTFFTLLSINAKLGGGNVIRPHTQQYTINDLSDQVYAEASSVTSHRSALVVNLKKGAVPVKRALNKFSEIIYTSRLEITKYGKIAADELTSFIKKYRPTMLYDYNPFFLKNLLIPQTLEMLDLTLGLDVLGEYFFLNVAFPGIQRHHPDRDKFYFNIFDIDDMANWRIKLLPLASDVHYGLHGNYKRQNNWQGYLSDNDLARARTKHLYEILQRPYNPKINYKSLLMDEFDKEVRTVNRRNIKIWEDFDPDILNSWIKRLVDKKTMSYEKWHLKHYDEFYTKRYGPYFKDYYSYINGDPKCKHPDFWEWYIKEYMPNNRYPIFY